MPDNRSYESSLDYIIKSVKITKSGVSAEIRNSVGVLEIFENIDLPYLTGRIYFKDDAKVFDSIAFDGVEECEIILSQPTKSPRDVRKTFIIKNVSDTRKVNDLAEVVSLYLIEKVAYDASLERFSKSYIGTPLEIVNKIAREKLNITIDQPSVTPIQKEMKVVIPYLTPFEAISFIMERMTTIDGLPYQLYSTINDENLQLKSLEELLSTPAWNANSPYRYSRAYTQGHTNHNSKQDPYVVMDYFAPNKGEDTFNLITNGAMGGQFSIVDVVTGRNETKSFEITTTLNKLKAKNIIPGNLQPVIETQYTDKQLQSLRSVDIHRAIMVNTYDDVVNNYYQEESIDSYELDMVRKSIKKVLFKSPVNLKVPGSPFLLGVNQSIGKQIEYVHLNNNLSGSETANTSEDKLRDKKRSGTYMIYSAHHVFHDTKHTTELSAVKLGKEI
jgi:hypothetical protein